MSRFRLHRGASLVALLLTLAALLPPDASAHGLVGRATLPVPVWLFAWAAAVVLIVSFAALGALWPAPRLQLPRERRLLRLGPWVDVLGGAVGIGLFVLVVWAGLAGTAVPTANWADTFVWVAFWVGTVVASVLFGDVFRILSPWRATARAFAWAGDHLFPGVTPPPMPYPRRLGHWPAALTIAGFAWLELVSVDRDDPKTLAWLAIGYAIVQLVGMSLYGIEAWTTRADGFGAYFGLFARVAPLHRRDGVLWLRRPLDGLPGMEPIAGTVALLCVMIGSTTFDGASQGPLWTSVSPHLQSAFASLGAGPTAAGELAFTLGLLAGFALVAAVYWLGVLGMRTVDRSRSPGALGRSFAHTLVPIALAYVLAHYFTLLVYQGQAMAYLASDPLGNGSDVFGTAQWAVNYHVIDATGIWYVQIAAILAGHVAALALAHDRALAIFRGGRDATRSQLWMLGVMVGFTCLALWLISAANQ